MHCQVVAVKQCRPWRNERHESKRMNKTVSVLPDEPLVALLNRIYETCIVLVCMYLSSS